MSRSTFALACISMESMALLVLTALALGVGGVHLGRHASVRYDWSRSPTFILCSLRCPCSLHLLGYSILVCSNAMALFVLAIGVGSIGMPVLILRRVAIKLLIRRACAYLLIPVFAGSFCSFVLDGSTRSSPPLLLLVTFVAAVIIAISILLLVLYRVAPSVPRSWWWSLITSASTSPF